MKKLSILVVAALLCVFALPAFAQDKADWSFYGSIRLWTAWESYDKEAPAINFGAPNTFRNQPHWPTGSAVGFDDSDLWFGMQYNARIGANVKWGDVGGRFEFGNLAQEGSGTGADSEHVRLLYGTWNFGAGTLVVGQDYTPYFYPMASNCGPSGGDCSGVGFATPYGGRKDQIKLIMGGFQLAFIEPAVRVNNGSGLPVQGQLLKAGIPNNRSTDIDRTIPKIEASYNFNAGPANIWFGGGFNTIKSVWIDGTSEKDVSVTAWTLGVGAKLPIGPFYVNFAGQYGRNPGDYGLPVYGPVVFAALNAAEDDTEDAKFWAAGLAAGFKLTSALSFEAGGLYVSTKQDVGANQFEWPYSSFYLVANWSPAKNVFLTPEIGVVNFGDFKETGQPDLDLGNLWYAGIKWMINF